jgi:hypothetical protein
MRVIATSLIFAVICGPGAAAPQRNTAERPPDLSLTAIGRQHHAIDTKNKEAQAYFDQG